MMKRLDLKTLGLMSLILIVGACFTACEGDEGEDGPRIPVILSFTPDSGEAGDNVTITGTDLGDATEVTIGEVAATIVSNTSTEIVITIPEGASTGKINVRTAGGLATSTADLTVVVIGAVTVSSISPVSAQAGENVTITGTDMKTVSSVKIGTVDATIVGTTDTSVEVTVPEGATIGLNSLTIVNTGGTNTTSTETTKFYVIKIHPDLVLTFDGEQEGIFTGSPDPEESTIYGPSSDATVSSTAQALPEAVDGYFFQMEGYSSTTISGNYLAIVQNTSALPTGTYAEFMAGATDQTVYFNIQVHVGELPTDYDDALMGLRFRFDGGDYEFVPKPSELTEMGFAPNEKGWYSLSIPLSAFDDGKAPGTYAITDMQRVGIAVRRNYGTGGTAGVQVTEADGGIFCSMSIDNVIVSVGGPYSY